MTFQEKPVPSPAPSPPPSSPPPSPPPPSPPPLDYGLKPSLAGRPAGPPGTPCKTLRTASPQRRVSGPFPECRKKLFQSLSAPANLYPSCSCSLFTIQEENDFQPSQLPPSPAPAPAPAQSPASPTPSPSPEQREVDSEDGSDGKEDVTDGHLSAILMNTVKSVVVYVLDHVLGVY